MRHIVYSRHKLYVYFVPFDDHINPIQSNLQTGKLLFIILCVSSLHFNQEVQYTKHIKIRFICVPGIDNKCMHLSNPLVVKYGALAYFFLFVCFSYRHRMGLHRALFKFFFLGFVYKRVIIVNFLVLGWLVVFFFIGGAGGCVGWLGRSLIQVCQATILSSPPIGWPHIQQHLWFSFGGYFWHISDFPKLGVFYIEYKIVTHIRIYNQSH